MVKVAPPAATLTFQGRRDWPIAQEIDDWGLTPVQQVRRYTLHLLRPIVERRWWLCWGMVALLALGLMFPCNTTPVARRNRTWSCSDVYWTLKRPGAKTLTVGRHVEGLGNVCDNTPGHVRTIHHVASPSAAMTRPATYPCRLLYIAAFPACPLV